MCTLTQSQSSTSTSAVIYWHPDRHSAVAAQAQYKDERCKQDLDEMRMRYADSRVVTAELLKLERSNRFA